MPKASPSEFRRGLTQAEPVELRAANSLAGAGAIPITVSCRVLGFSTTACHEWRMCPGAIARYFRTDRMKGEHHVHGDPT